GRRRVDAAEPAEQDWIVVIVELSGEEEGPGKPVVLGAVMAVVLVGRDRVASEVTVVLQIERQLVAVAEQDRLAVAADHQLRGNGSVERPELERVLQRKRRVEDGRAERAAPDTGVELLVAVRVVLEIGPGALLGDLDGDARREAAELLVRPVGAGRA